MKFHSQQELISDLESIQEVATKQFAEIFCLTDNTEQLKGKQFLCLPQFHETELDCSSCDKTLRRWIQISRKIWNGFFSNISNQSMI